MREIHNATGVIYEGAAVRSEGYWLDGPAKIRGVFPTLGVQREDKLVAYVNVESDDDEAWIKEACALTGHEDAFEKLAGAVLSLSAGKKVEGSLPKDHVFVRVLEAAAGVSPVWDTHDEMMVKAVNWDALRQKLGLDAVPDHAPNAEEDFWRNLLVESPFYWWTDIFICVLAVSF